MNKFVVLLVSICLFKGEQKHKFEMKFYNVYGSCVKTVNASGTTNTIEGYHRQIRKVTKSKGVFTSDMALLKLICLATERIAKKWTTMPLHGWAILSSASFIVNTDIKW